MIIFNDQQQLDMFWSQIGRNGYLDIKGESLTPVDVVIGMPRKTPQHAYRSYADVAAEVNPILTSSSSRLTHLSSSELLTPIIKQAIITELKSPDFIQEIHSMVGQSIAENTTKITSNIEHLQDRVQKCEENHESLQNNFFAAMAAPMEKQFSSFQANVLEEKFQMREELSSLRECILEEKLSKSLLGADELKESFSNIDKRMEGMEEQLAQISQLYHKRPNTANNENNG